MRRIDDWAAGFSLVKLPVVDSDGYPIQRREVTGYPGLYFLELPWLHSRRSGILFGLERMPPTLLDKAKVEPKTVQGIPMHAKIQTSMDLHTQENCHETRTARG